MLEPLRPTPVQMYGFHDGANSPQQSALKWQESQNNAQASLNGLAKGGKRKHLKRGGSSDSIRARTVEVPQFPQIGPAVSPVDANSSSIIGNTTAITGANDATNDCYATNSCVNGGGKRKYKHSSTKHKSMKHKSMKHKSMKHKRKTMKHKSMKHKTMKYKRKSTKSKSMKHKHKSMKY